MLNIREITRNVAHKRCIKKKNIVLSICIFLNRVVYEVM